MLLVKYGWHGVGALIAMIHDDMEQRNFREYTANHIWAVAHAVYGLAGSELTTNPYSQLIHPDVDKEETSEEIKAKVLAMLA